MSLSYMMIGSNDLARSNRFYQAVVSALGGEVRAADDEQGGWFVLANGDSLIVARPFDGRDASFGNGMMFGLGCASQAQVQAAHAAALVHGGTDEGAPGLRLDYSPDFYGAYVRDPDGNKMSFVFKGG